MKKLISLFLSLVLAVSFTACSNKNGKRENSIDLEYFANLGQMPEAKYSLGENPQTIIDELSKEMKKQDAEHGEDPNHSHGHDESMFFFEVTEGEKNVLLDNGNICYYYNKANKDKGVSCIVNYDTAYEFPIGTVILELKNSLSNVKFTEEPINEQNAFFASYVLDGTVLKAEFEKSTVVFVFQENELFATAIYNNNWNN
ncbi:MAG: hypothetical protein E7537_03625 [Ruminococcaceae bacterium]|nr:hypothetical protein [Oscillospiraceae bacterium]